jgi:hypothetical protein
MTNYERAEAWLKACGKEPDTENLSVLIGCHLEEFCEFLGALRSDSEGYGKLLERTRTDLDRVRLDGVSGLVAQSDLGELRHDGRESLAQRRPERNHPLAA